MTQLTFNFISPNSDLSEIVHVLNISHGTVAKEFGFNKENNPGNNAFIDAEILKSQLEKGINLYSLNINRKIVGCIAIEKPFTEENTFYIEKVSVIPEFRNHGYGVN